MINESVPKMDIHVDIHPFMLQFILFVVNKFEYEFLDYHNSTQIVWFECGHTNQKPDFFLQNEKTENLFRLEYFQPKKC